MIALATQISGATSREIEDRDNSNGGEFSWMWTMNCWSPSDQDSIKCNVITLMEAAGQRLDKDSHKKSMPELLQAFHVGTECRKEWKQRSKLPPKPSDLGPIKDMEFLSTSSRAKLTMRPKVEVEVDLTNEHVEAIAEVL